MKKYYIYTLVFILISCHNRVNTIMDIECDTVNISDDLKYVNNIKDSIGNPNFIVSFDRYVIIADDNKHNIVTAYNLKTETFRTLINKGRAANEIYNVHQINTLPHNSGFYIFDNINGKQMSFNIMENTIQQTSNEKVSGFWTYVLDDSLMFGVDHNNKFRYKVKNSQNGSFGFGNYDAYSFSNELGNSLLQGLLAINPEKQRCAWFSFYGESFEVLEYTKPGAVILSKTYNLPIFDKHIYKGEEHPIMNLETVIGFTSLTTSNDYIIVLYSGHKLEDALTKRDGVVAGNNIIIFDWNGNIIKKLVSKSNIKCISYNNFNNLLYCIIEMADGYTLATYKLDC